MGVTRRPGGHHGPVPQRLARCNYLQMPKIPLVCILRRNQRGGGVVKLPTLNSYPQNLPTPHLHSPKNSIRVDPYAHSHHHFKVPKHFVYYIQYGFGIKSEACCSLNHYIATSLWLRSTLPPQNDPQNPPLPASQS